jgi:hypothetical protein
MYNNPFYFKSQKKEPMLSPTTQASNPSGPKIGFRQSQKLLTTMLQQCEVIVHYEDVHNYHWCCEEMVVEHMERGI